MHSPVGVVGDDAIAALSNEVGATPTGTAAPWGTIVAQSPRLPSDADEQLE